MQLSSLEEGASDWTLQPQQVFDPDSRKNQCSRQLEKSAGVRSRALLRKRDDVRRGLPQTPSCSSPPPPQSTACFFSRIPHLSIGTTGLPRTQATNTGGGRPGTCPLTRPSCHQILNIAQICPPPCPRQDPQILPGCFHRLLMVSHH